MDGNHTPRAQQVQKAAEFLERVICKNDSTGELHQGESPPPDISYKTSEFTMGEQIDAIEKRKRRKATGEDEIPNEVFKQLNAENQEKLRKMYNKWLSEEYIDQAYLRATMVLIYKKR